jgi:hypothetical protein
MNLILFILKEINDNPALKELKGLKFTKPDEEVSKQSSNEKIDTNASSNKNKGFNFVVMIKKGNKTQYHNMEVPMTSDFANQVHILTIYFFDIINEI